MPRTLGAAPMGTDSGTGWSVGRGVLRFPIAEVQSCTLSHNLKLQVLTLGLTFQRGCSAYWRPLRSRCLCPEPLWLSCPLSLRKGR